MITKIFLLIELVLKLFKLWDLFADHVSAKRAAEIEEKRKNRQKAIDDAKKAETDEEIWKSQDEIVRNQP